jgi:hypothetical protein
VGVSTLSIGAVATPHFFPAASQIQGSVSTNRTVHTSLREVSISRCRLDYEWVFEMRNVVRWSLWQLEAAGL